MLRITLHEEPRSVTFRLEGRLAGAWVRVLEECWRSAATGRRDQLLRLDLIGVTHIDAAGQACLAVLQRQGAKFIAADPATKQIIEEITQGQPPDWECKKDKGFE
jgi:ABC-type transporter Mla MlaB component